MSRPTESTTKPKRTPARELEELFEGAVAELATRLIDEEFPDSHLLSPDRSDFLTAAVQGGIRTILLNKLGGPCILDGATQDHFLPLLEDVREFIRETRAEWSPSPHAPASPLPFKPPLIGWKAILEALGNQYSKRHVARLNESTNGPIHKGGRHKPTTVDPDELESWWKRIRP